MDLGSSTPIVSVVMPVYNAAAFLKYSIESILQQTFTDFELIMINDGSTDASEQIIRKYTDKRIRYFDQPNAGVAKTLNRGVALATGKYIWRHDADDISLPQKLKTELEFLEANPDVALCAVQVAFMTESGKVAKKFKQPNDKSFDNLPVMEVTRDKFNPYCPITHGTVLVRTAVIKDLNGYRPEFITGEDVDLWLRLIQKQRAVVLHQCLSYHRLSKASATKVHGWKNTFFRNLAFKFYDQRALGNKDDLEKELQIALPEAPATVTPVNVPTNGRIFRDDLLSYKYPLHLNAKDWSETFVLVRMALKDGWKLSRTWKAILFPLIGEKLVRTFVKIKSVFK